MDAYARYRTQDELVGRWPVLRVAEPRRVAYAARAKAASPSTNGPSPIEQAALRDTIRQLRLTLSVLTVAIGALRRQNADNDADVAEVLERFASDRLDIQIERLEALLAGVVRAS